jgi:hypothetical protein
MNKYILVLGLESDDQRTDHAIGGNRTEEVHRWKMPDRSIHANAMDTQSRNATSMTSNLKPTIAADLRTAATSIALCSWFSAGKFPPEYRATRLDAPRLLQAIWNFDSAKSTA